jgi:hypothetical protein
MRTWGLCEVVDEQVAVCPQGAMEDGAATTLEQQQLIKPAVAADDAAHTRTA